MPILKPINEESLAKYKAEIRKSVSLSQGEKRCFQQLDNEFFRSSLRDIYHGDVTLARQVMSGNYSKINKDEAKAPLKEIQTISRAFAIVVIAVRCRKPILLIGDNDADGSFGQGIGLEFKFQTGADITTSPKTFSPAQHSFSIQQIDDWVADKGISPDSDFVVITVDIGTNQRAEQSAFIARYPNAKLIITDHHTPKLSAMVEEDLPNSILVSPYMVGSLSTGNTSYVAGGYILNVVLEMATREILSSRGIDADRVSELVKPMEAMAEASNLLDCIEGDVRLKPLLQALVDKARECGQLITIGGLGGWVSSRQSEKIMAFGQEVNAPMSESLFEIRNNILRQNHLAKSLLGLFDRLGEKDIKIGDELLKASSVPYDASDDVDYISRIKGPLVHLTYNNELSGKDKSDWLKYAGNVFKSVSREEKAILNFIREHKLLSERSNNEVVITEPVHSMVESLFSSAQLRKAHFGMARPMHISVKHSGTKLIRANIRSSVSLFDALGRVAEKFPAFEFGFNGHGGSGELSISTKSGQLFPADILDQLQAYMTEKVNELKVDVELDNLVEVDFANIGLIGKINEVTKAVVYGGEERQIQAVIQLSDDLVVMDSFSRETLSLSDVVEKNPWEYTKFDIDFHDTVAILSNSAIKTILDSGFKAKAKFTQIGSKAFMLNDVITPEQQDRANIVKLKTNKDKEQARFSKFYNDNFVKPDVTAIPVTRQEAKDAILFNKDGDGTFNRFEAVILGVMDGLGSDAHVVFDVETADGLGQAAKLTNIGLLIYVREPNSGKNMSAVDFDLLKISDPDSILNSRFVESSNSYIVNEELKIELSSKFVYEEDTNVLVSIENLTSISNSMLKEYGSSVEEVQASLVAYFTQFNLVTFQAHNLPFDDSINASNMPGFKHLTDEHIYLDTALLAKDERLAYMNTEVAYIEREPFVSGVSGSYNLLSLLKDESKENFQFPSLKNNKLIKVIGEDVYLTTRKSQTTSKLSMTRDELAEYVKFNTQELSAKDVQYGIQKLMKMASIRDVIETVPAPALEKVAFNSFGLPKTVEDLWDDFQSHYAFDQTMEANISKFIKNPDVAAVLLSDMSVEVPNINEIPEVQIAREFGTGDMFNPNPKKKRTKKAQAAFENTRYTLTPMDVLKANTIEFLGSNVEMQNRYANSWAYLNVLDHYEPSMKHVDADIISGVSNVTGVSVELIKRVYNETYDYRKNTRGGVDSYAAEETHKNDDLTGDAYQEGLVFNEALVEASKNPHAPEAIHEPAVKLIMKSVAETCINVLVNRYVGDVLEGVKLNSFSHKQIENYSRSDEMLRYVSDDKARGKLKSRNLPDGYYIELQDMTAAQWSVFSTDEKEDIETKLNVAVDGLIIANSLGLKAVSTDSRTILENVATSPAVNGALKELREKLGRMVVTNREGAMRVLIKDVLRAGINDDIPKFKINKSLSPDDLAFCREAIVKGSDILSNRVGAPFTLSMSHLDDAIRSMEIQYEIFEHITLNGTLDESLKEKYEDEIVKSVKYAVTKAIKSAGGTLSEHEALNKELALSVTTTKTDPIKFILGGDTARVAEILSPTIPLPENKLEEMEVGRYFTLNEGSKYGR
tara:strand:- start:504 stop:5291 length:4788 start_codon:yes stop_codon:yes gene_type:complete